MSGTRVSKCSDRGAVTGLNLTALDEETESKIVTQCIKASYYPDVFSSTVSFRVI